MAPVTTNRAYDDYDPPSDVVSEDGCNTILIYLPGYKKEQLKVQLTTSRILKISGERQIGDNKWRRFHKEFPVPTNCDTKNITAKFEGGILYIRQPKLITPESATPDQPADQGKTAAQPPKTPQQQQQLLDVPPQQPPARPRPQPQPRPEARLQPQLRPEARPQPQLRPEARPQPQLRPEARPQPQPQPEAPLPEPQKGFEEEEKTRRNETEEDAVEKEKRSETTKKDEEGIDQCGWKERPTQVGGGRGFFSELRKPENLKRLAVSVILVLSIGFYATYMFKSFVGDVKELNYPDT